MAQGPWPHSYPGSSDWLEELYWVPPATALPPHAHTQRRGPEPSLSGPEGPGPAGGGSLGLSRFRGGVHITKSLATWRPGSLGPQGSPRACTSL